VLKGATLARKKQEANIDVIAWQHPGKRLFKCPCEGFKEIRGVCTFNLRKGEQLLLQYASHNLGF
jgi:hypothetical protein